jgi:hypothetical protein
VENRASKRARHEWTENITTLTIYNDNHVHL